MTDWILDVVQTLGYWGVGLLALLENAFPPIPSEIIMPLAGYLALDGRMTLAGAIAAGSIGSVVGCIGWYVVGRKIGEKRLRKWIDRHGHWLTLCPEDIDSASRMLAKHGPAVVFFGRLIPGIRTWVSVPAGLTAMPPGKFFLYTTAGTVLWTSFLTGAGYWLGASFPQVEKYLGPVSTVIFGFILLWYIWRVIQQKRAKAECA